MPPHASTTVTTDANCEHDTRREKNTCGGVQDSAATQLQVAHGEKKLAREEKEQGKL